MRRFVRTDMEKTIDTKFAEAFHAIWNTAERDLAALGIVVGSEIRNKHGDLFRITSIQPRVHNFGNPGGSISVYGVKFRANSTWGTHEHWVGNPADLLLD